jgi:osmotically inducible protein OsmC
MITRKASATWTGELKTGAGYIALGSGAFEGKYSFGTRFEGAPGTNPEELIGAAHAGCYSMAFNLMLTNAGFAPKRVQTTAEVKMEKVGEGMQITGIHLVTVGEVPGISQEKFLAIATDAKNNCIISKALAAVPMTLDATLQG